MYPEQIDTLTQIANTTILLIGAMAAVFFMMYYMRERKQQRKQESYDKATIDETAQVGINSGGYIVIDLHDTLRGTFTDLLKGFEEFAKLKGYSISFSVDNSLSNKIGFKFTILEGGVGVSTQTVRKDINEYITRVQNGGSFEDLPQIISQQEHIVVSTALKNRINFLTHNYTLEKNTREAYELIFKKLNQTNQGVTTQPSIFIQTGGVNTPNTLVANNSNSVALGESIVSETSVTSNYDNSIQITNSFNKRKEQVNKLDELIAILHEEEIDDRKAIRDLIISFSKVKDELQEEESPDKNRIQRWLLQTKGIVETVVLSHEASQAIQWIYNNLGFLA